MGPILVFLIRPVDLAGRLGGGLKRFVEVAARIHRRQMKYVIIESEPFLKSFTYFARMKEVTASHVILSSHVPWEAGVNRRVIGPILFWLKLLFLSVLGIRSVRSTLASLVLAPGETFPEVITVWICSKITGRRGVVVVQSDPFLSTQRYNPRDFGTFYAAYRARQNPLAAFVEALIAMVHKRAMNDMSLLILGRNLSQSLVSRGISGVMRVQVENGIDFETINAVAPSEFRSDAIYIGRIDVSKGVGELLHSWLEMVQEGERFRLTLAGPTAEHLRDELGAIVSSSRECIAFLGALTDLEAISVLKSSRVLVLPSRFEGASLVTAEALACGIPVVSYGSSGSREFFPTPAVSMVPMGEIGKLIDRVKQILENDDERSRLARIGREFVSRYDWEKVADQEADIYRQLAGSPLN